MTNTRSIQHDDDRVSVIIPCYRQARYLPEAIDSILRQTYSNIEIIVVNDGSDDETGEVAKSYGDRVRYVWKENGGLSSARNAGLAAANGEWIQFLDADDLIHPAKIETQLRESRAEDEPDIIYSDYRYFADERPTEEWRGPDVQLDSGHEFQSFLERWERSLTIPIHALLYRSTCFERWGNFDTSLPAREDWDWHLRCAFHRAKFQFVPGDLVRYRVHGKSMCRDNQSMMAGRRRCLCKWMQKKGLQPSDRAVLRERYIADETIAILNLIKRGRHFAASRAIAGMLTRPEFIRYPRIPITIGYRLFEHALQSCFTQQASTHRGSEESSVESKVS